MSERKEIIKKVEEKKALQEALKEIKKEDKKRALKKIFALIKKGLVNVWVGLVKLKDGLVYVFHVANSFRNAMNLQAQIKIRDAQTEEQTKKLVKANNRKTIVVALLAFLIGMNIPDKDITIKETPKSVKGASIEAFAEEVESEQTASNEQATNVAKGRSIEIADSGEQVQPYLIGKISSKFELGTEEISTIIKNRDGETLYGQFSSDNSREDYVIGFLKHMNTNEKDMYVNNFSGSDAPGTESFNSHWENATKKEGVKFDNMQIEYKWNTIVKPTVDKINKELNIDFSKTLLLQELIYSTVSQYESEKAFEIVKNANLNANMSEVEILNAVQDAKEASLGKYTYTNESGYNDDYRNIIKNRINSERIELSRLVGKQADVISEI